MLLKKKYNKHLYRPNLSKVNDGEASIFVRFLATPSSKYKPGRFVENLCDDRSFVWNL